MRELSAERMLVCVSIVLARCVLGSADTSSSHELTLSRERAPVAEVGWARERLLREAAKASCERFSLKDSELAREVDSEGREGFEPIAA